MITRSEPGGHVGVPYTICRDNPTDPDLKMQLIDYSRFFKSVHDFCLTELRKPLKAEEIMWKANKNNAHEGAVCIANNGAAARCALGLLVVVVLLLSNQ
jgi:hypothetical protein